MKENRYLSVVGIGPGGRHGITKEAENEIKKADIVVGYPLYLSLLSDLIQEKQTISTPMRKEVERVRLALEAATKGKRTVLVCSGDAGIYGMASLAWELSKEYPDTGIRVISGVTAAGSGAALLGAPLGNDFCVISLSDYLTSWEMIEKRIRAAAAADFVIVFYNPASKSRPDSLARACEILLEETDGKRLCGIVRNIARNGEEYRILSLCELKEIPVDMLTTVFIGNSRTRQIRSALVTPRGYQL